MSDLSYLDTISNKELLAKCLEHGLPGVPVTDSTRNVIVKRLKAAILGTPLNKSQKKNNNNKIANSAATSKKATPRRETIHGGSKASHSPIRSTNNNYNEHSRRTIAHGQGLDNTSVSGRSIQTTTTVSDVGSQSEDDDYWMVQAPHIRYSKPTQTLPNRGDPQLRRSVSLTKSGVLTTSYTREIEKPHYDDVDMPQSHTYERPTVHSPPLPSYEPNFRRTMARDLGSGPKPRLTQTQLNSTSYLEDAGYNQSPKTFSGSVRPFAEYSASGTNPLQQRQTIGGGRPLQPPTTANTLYPQLNQFYEPPARNATEQQTDSESELEEEPSLRPTRYTPQRTTPLARPQSRRPIAHHDAPMQQFRELIKSLNAQYHLKYYFFIILAAMLGSLVYVLMTPV